MAEINFYLRDPLAEKTTIYVYASYDGYRAKFSTGIRISSKFWNANKQKAKDKAVTFRSWRSTAWQCTMLNQRELFAETRKEIEKKVRMRRLRGH